MSSRAAQCLQYGIKALDAAGQSMFDQICDFLQDQDNTLELKWKLDIKTLAYSTTHTHSHNLKLSQCRVCLERVHLLNGGNGSAGCVHRVVTRQCMDTFEEPRRSSHSNSHASARGD